MKLNSKRIINVGFAFFLICVFWQAYDTIIPKILTDKFGMSQTWSGVIMALDNILAIILLPLFGALSDKCRSRRGRRTPFIVTGTILAAVLLFLLSFADNTQLGQLKAVVPENPTALETLYERGYTVNTPDGKTVVLNDRFTKEEFTSITQDTEVDGVNYYSYYVIPARMEYAREQTKADSAPLLVFIAMLVLVLLSMSLFRSPAVALMPDVTIKPLRSKANSIINLMGAVGGALALLAGSLIGTDKAKNALMSYTGYFTVISCVMLAALAIFMLKVREPRFVEEMREESKKFGLDEEDSTGEPGEKRSLTRPEKRSLILLLASIVLWFFGYNAIISKYSVYSGSVLNLGYSGPLLAATVTAIFSYIPVGLIATKIGRKKTIIAGVIILALAFFAASFLRAGVPIIAMYVIFAFCGMGWATINVNSYPMVVELSKGGDVGKYTGIYYTASMAAQILTPILSGRLMDRFGMAVLFPYGTAFVLFSCVTMLFVMHGDSKPERRKKLYEHLEEAD
ncbi:MAG: SLC45 family MFS transporter [Clostridiales bacterium]|nr:SLC45 family MFS transporter [Clostridiales bacterium]